MKRIQCDVVKAFLGLAMSGVVGVVALSASGATNTWSGAVDGNWTEPGNWVEGVAPTNNAALTFAGATQVSNFNNYAANTRFDGIAFAPGAGAFKLYGNDIDLDGDVVDQSTSEPEIRLKLKLLRDTVFQAPGVPSDNENFYNLTVGNFPISDGGSGFGLLKTGRGVLSLKGKNTYTGATQVRQGSLRIDMGYAGEWDPLISSSSPLVMAGDHHAAKLYLGGTWATKTQTFNGTTLKAGWSYMPIYDVGPVFNVNFGTFVREPGAFLTLVLPTAGSATVDASTPLYNGILGGWAVVRTNWLTHSAGTLTPYTSYTVPAGADPVIASDASAHLTLDTTSSGTASFSSTVTDLATLRLVDSANRTVDIGSGKTLRLGRTGALWRALPANNANGLLVSGGTLTAGGADNTAGELILNAGGMLNDTTSRANVGIRITSAITDNGSGALGVTKMGPQTVVLAGANTYSGDTHVLQGRLLADSHANSPVHVFDVDFRQVAWSKDDATVDNGAFWLTGAQDYGNVFYLSGIGPRQLSGYLSFNYGALVITNSAARVTGTVTLMHDARIGAIGGVLGHLVGQITGPGGLEVNGENQMSSTTLLYNTANDWAGDTTISLAGLDGNKARLRLAASNVIPNGAGKGDVVFLNKNGHDSAEARLELWGHDETVNGLVSAGANTYGTGRRILNGVAGTTSALTVGDGDADATFFGTVENGAGTLAIRKIGAGTQTFSGASTYTGTTEVAAGTLKVSGSLTGTAGVSASAGGTFAYVGASALDRAVTLAGGTFLHSSTSAYTGSLTFDSGRIAGTNWLGNLNGLTLDTERGIAPGGSVGTAYTANQTWSSGGSYVFDIANAAGTAGTGWDLVSGSGTLTLSGMTMGGFTVKVTSLDAKGAEGLCANFDPKAVYEWTLAEFAGVSGSFASSFFTVDATGFANETVSGFRVLLRGNQIILSYGGPLGTMIKSL